MSRLIDWHAHFLPPAFADLLRARRTAPFIARDASGLEVRVTDARTPGQPLRPTFLSLDARLRANDHAGVERQVLSLPALGADHLPPAEQVALARAYNDALASVVAAHPDRFSGLAALPADHVELAAQELERAVRELGLLGALLPVDAFLTLPGSRQLAPVFAVAEQHSAHLFIHPGAWRGSRSLGAADDGVPFRSAVIDLQGRIASAFATLAYSDFLDAFPSVTIQIANLGGAIPFYVDRLHNVAHERGLSDPLAPLRRFYVDTGSQGTRSIELAVSVLGADRVLFGTDDPVFSLTENARAIEAAFLSDADKRRIFSENGRALLERSAFASVLAASATPAVAVA